MVRLGDEIVTPHLVARTMSDAGLQVFPARFKDKIPLIKWEKFQGQNVADHIDKWFTGRGNVNYWIMTGQTASGQSIIVIDGDTADGEAWWRKYLGPVLDETTRVKTSKGHHYYFKIPESWTDPVPSWSVHPSEKDGHNISFDVRADKTGVIAPPSIHESGFKYEWEVPLSAMQEAPLALLDGTARAASPVATGASGAGTGGAGGTARSMLSKLLAQPPGSEGSGRNDWLARVAGHYAKTYHNQEDLYEAHCLAANRMMGEPLEDTEFRKTVDSVWRGEHERNTHRALDASCGFLQSGNTIMLCQVVYGQNDDKRYDLAEFADFDLTAKGVMQDEAGRRTYLATINRKNRNGGGTESLDIVLRAEILGDDRALRKFLASYACTVVPPDNMWPKTGSPGVRIQRYLESQRPPVVIINDCLGYDPHAIRTDEGGYVTHEGVITASGLYSLDAVAVRADPRLKVGGTAPHEYGFDENEVIAQQTLDLVTTFHDEHVTAVFGAWWAACLLKPQIEAQTSLFPFMAIEAPSESGKTNGFFAMMTQLNGNTRGETQPTKAALRDMAAAHRNGIVWVDDLDDPAYLMELLRAATSGGSLTKMGEDRESVKNTPIVSPIVISGEALGLGTQKALVDRAVLIKAPSPTERRSAMHPDRPQWDDILDVRRQYPAGLASIAGWFVQDALSVVDETLAVLAAGRAGGSGRATDKVAVLRAGARLLDYLVRQDGAWEGQGRHALRLEEWLTHGDLVDADGVAQVSNHNALTLEVLPWALREGTFPHQSIQNDERWRGDTPAFVRRYELKDGKHLFGEDTEVWFSPALLAQAWSREHHGRVERRTHTEAAFKDQASAVGGKSKRVKIAQSGGRLAYYYQITGDAAVTVLRRAIGLQ